MNFIPLGRFKNWEECIRAQKQKGYTDEEASKICGFIEKRTKEKNKRDKT